MGPINLGRSFGHMLGAAGKFIGKVGLTTGEILTGTLGEGAIKGTEAIGKSVISHSLSMPEKVILGAGTGAAIGGMLADQDGQVNPGRAAVKGGAVALGISAIPGGAAAMSTIGLSTLGAAMTGVKGVSLFGNAMLKAPSRDVKVNFGNVGDYKLSKLAIPVLMGSALLSGISGGLKTFEKSRMGTNDGQFRSATPNYQNIQNDTYGVTGNQQNAIPSFAANAGATGDLVFAMYNGTH